MLGIDRGSGGEFINHQLLDWCVHNDIKFTRGRPYRKNDNGFVEQKNGGVVRKTVGYSRFGGQNALNALSEVYRFLNPLLNYRHPTLRLTAKKKLPSGRYKKIYEKYPKTPYQRLLKSPHISEECRAELRRRTALLNPIALKRGMDEAGDRLLKLSVIQSAIPSSKKFRKKLSAGFSFEASRYLRLCGSNLETVMGVTEIPSSVQITALLNGIGPDSLSDVFNENLKMLDTWDGLKEFRCLDGVWYFSSEQIHCLHKSKDGIATYFHSTLAGTIVRLGNTAVLPAAPEMTTNTDGAVHENNYKKQDCERNAAKRWISKRADEYTRLSPTLLGKSRVYSNYPFCKEVLEKGYSFIFTCKEDSRPWLTETVKNSYLRETSRREWNGRHNLKYACQRLNGVQIRGNKETLLVNYLSLSIWNEKVNKRSFFNTWITNKKSPPQSSGVLKIHF